VRFCVLGDRDRSRRQAKHALEGRTRPAIGQVSERERDEIVEQNHDVAAGSCRALVGLNRAPVGPEGAAHIEDVLGAEAQFRSILRRRDAAPRELQFQRRSKRKRQRKSIHAPDIAKDVRSPLLSFPAKQRREIMIQAVHVGKNIGMALVQAHQGFGVFDLDALNAA